jgi:SAM-dependent methyltransferase
MGWLGDLNDQKKVVSRVGLIPAYDHFMNFGNAHDEEAGLPAIWKINGEKNLPWLDDQKNRVSSVHDIPKYKDKVIIFVGMAPSLKNSWKHLKGLSDRFIVVATNSSAKFLGEHGIYPHYVLLLDGKPGTWTLDLGKKFKDVIGIFGPAAEPQAMRDWPGKIMIIPLGVKDKSLNRRIRKRWGKTLPSGGNSINSAVSIFSLLTDSKIFVFVGNDLSFKDTYYADRRCDNDDSGYFWAIDIHGEKVKTLIPLYEYKIWLETVMSQNYPEYSFIDCSDGILGVDVDGELLTFCAHAPLDVAISEIEDAFEIEAKPLDYKLKYLYDQFYDHDLGNMQRGKGIWKYLLEYHDFKKGLDVGCGRANGVQYAREQGADVYGCDVSTGAVKCWKDRGVDQYCRVASADNLPYANKEFDMVLCSEVMEHIPEENVLKVLKEIFRVGSDKYFFTIALVPESIPVAHLVQSHICLKDPKWWVEKLEEAGMVYCGGSINQDATGFSVLMVKDPRKYISGKKSVTKAADGKMVVMVLGPPGPGSELLDSRTFDL